MSSAEMNLVDDFIGKLITAADGDEQIATLALMTLLYDPSLYDEDDQSVPDENSTTKSS